MGIRHELLCFQLADNSAHNAELIATVGNKRLAGILILYQFNSGEQTDAAYVSDALVLCLEFFEYLAEDIAALVYIIEDIVVLVVVQAGNADCAGKRVSAVGKSALENVFVEIFRNLLADCNADKLNITAGNAFREAYDIRLYAEILEREHLAGAPEASHNLVADHHDAVVVADLAHSCEVALRGNDNAVGTGDGFHDDGVS